MTANSAKDFFISYNKADLAWAEWIAWTLEQAGMTTHLQAWDFRPGTNFVLAMHEAIQTTKHIIAVLSPAYLTHAPYSAAEWAAAFVQDPTGTNKILLPIRVQDCDPTGLLASIVYIDIVECDEVTASGKVLAGIDPKRAKPTTAPTYPGKPSPVAGPGPHYPTAWPALCTVPYARNPFFCGRDALLHHLNERLISGKTTALTQAISGLGGIGKTQIAIEYAYRYGYTYRYVLWVSMATPEAMLNDCVELVTRLHIPAFDPQDQRTVLPALREWLTEQRHWLLILDNADDLTLVRSFLPPKPHPDGRILLTTRAQATGAIAQSIIVEKMEQDEGVLLLLRRASLIETNEPPTQVTSENRIAAETIVGLLGGLPLALDQAGGYIEETGCTLQDYVLFYQRHRGDLLNWKSSLSSPYPATVATTWSLAFERIRQANPAAAALLQFCAFLAPDAIPEAIITEASVASIDILATIATDAFERNTAFELLRRHSLLRRNAETKTFSIHRLVQVVVQDNMPPEMQYMWAERVINTIHKIFARTELSPALEPYVPHAYACLEMIERYTLITPNAAQLLQDTGNYLLQYARYKDAQAFYLKALSMLKQFHDGQEHLALALPLYRIGQLYYFQDRYHEAEDYYRQALEIYTKLQGETCAVGETFHALGRLYHRQGRYQQGEHAYTETLNYYTEAIRRDEKLHMAIVLHELATLYEEQGKYLQAKEVFTLVKSAIVIKPELMADDTSMQAILNVLTEHYRDKDEYAEIEALYQELLDASEQQLGAEHPTTAAVLHEFGWHRRGQGNYEEADAFYQRALGIREKILGVEHANTAATLDYLAELRLEQGMIEEAKELYYRTLNIRKKILGDKHISTGATLHELARISEIQNRNEEAEVFYRQALSIYEDVLGVEHPDIARVLNELARVYETQCKYEEALQVDQETLAICEKNQKTEPQYIISILLHMAKLYQIQQEYEMATTYYRRVLHIQEKALGLDHVDTIKTCQNYAALQRTMGRESVAAEIEARIERS